MPRRTVHDKPTKAALQVDPRFTDPIKAVIEKEPFFGHRTVARLSGFNKNAVQRPRPLSRTHGVRGLDPDQGLAGPQAPDRHAPRTEAVPSVATAPNGR